MPENDFKMTQKVIYKLKLNDPIILDRNNAKNIQSGDLFVKSNSLQFLNCSIKIKEKTKYQNFEVLSLQELNKNINISTGYSNSKVNQKFPIRLLY